MDNDMQKLSDDALDALLADLAEPAPEPSSELLGRVLGDAYDTQPQAKEAPVMRRRASPLSVLGGWVGLGGLAVAASVGFFVGVNPPMLLENQLSVFLGTELSALDGTGDFYGFEFLLEDDAL